MCTVLLIPGVYPIAVKYIISYHIISYHIIYTVTNKIIPKMDGLTTNRPKSLTESFRSTRTRKLTIQGRSFMTLITLSLCKWNSNGTSKWKYYSHYDSDGELWGPTLSLLIHWQLCDYHIPTYSPTYIKASAVLYMLDREVLLRLKYHGLFYVHGSVHHNILWNNQQMQLYAVNFIHC